jgi:hypothetical protein
MGRSPKAMALANTASGVNIGAGTATADREGVEIAEVGAVGTVVAIAVVTGIAVRANSVAAIAEVANNAAEANSVPPANRLVSKKSLGSRGLRVILSSQSPFQNSALEESGAFFFAPHHGLPRTCSFRNRRAAA